MTLYHVGLYAEIFVEGGIYLSLLWFNTTLYLVCIRPKYHWSSIRPDLVPHAQRNCPIFHGIFFPLWKEGKVTAKESESVTDTTPYFEQNTQTNPMSVRGDLGATRFIVCNFTLPSPWPGVIGVEWLQRYTEVSKSWSFPLDFGINSTGKSAWWECV